MVVAVSYCTLGVPLRWFWWIYLLLVGGWALPLWKIYEWKSVGMMTFPIPSGHLTGCELENGPVEIVFRFPINSMVIFQSFAYVYQKNNPFIFQTTKQLGLRGISSTKHMGIPIKGDIFFVMCPQLRTWFFGGLWIWGVDDIPRSWVGYDFSYITGLWLRLWPFINLDAPRRTRLKFGQHKEKKQHVI